MGKAISRGRSDVATVTISLHSFASFSERSDPESTQAAGRPKTNDTRRQRRDTPLDRLTLTLSFQLPQQKKRKREKKVRFEPAIVDTDAEDKSLFERACFQHSTNASYYLLLFTAAPPAVKRRSAMRKVLNGVRSADY